MTETFDEFSTPVNIYTPETVIGGIYYDVPVTAPSNSYWTIGVHLGVPITPPNDFGSNGITIDQLSFGPNQYALSLGFYLLSNPASPATSWTVLVTELNGQHTTLLLNSVAGQLEQHYFGLTSTQGIRQVNVFDSDPISRTNWSYDNVSHSAVLAAPVPEPALWGVVALLVIGIFVRVRRAESLVCAHHSACGRDQTVNDVA